MKDWRWCQSCRIVFNVCGQGGAFFPQNGSVVDIKKALHLLKTCLRLWNRSFSSPKLFGQPPNQPNRNDIQPSFNYHLELMFLAWLLIWMRRPFLSNKVSQSQFVCPSQAPRHHRITSHPLGLGLQTFNGFPNRAVNWSII